MAYSNDLRVRVIHVVESGAAARAAARQFAIGDSTAIRWAKRWRETGSFEAKSVKGQSRSPLKRYEEWLLELVRREPDLTLEEIRGRLLDEHQRKAGISSIWRFFDRHGISFKKKACARPSRIGLTLPRRVPNGPSIKQNSILNAWSSSTRPAHRPTWLDCAGGRHAANGWSARFRRVTGRPPPSWRPCDPPRSPRLLSSTVR
jgi:transposase